MNNIDRKRIREAFRDVAKAHDALNEQHEAYREAHTGDKAVVAALSPLLRSLAPGAAPVAVRSGNFVFLLDEQGEVDCFDLTLAVDARNLPGAALADAYHEIVADFMWIKEVEADSDEGRLAQNAYARSKRRLIRNRGEDPELPHRLVRVCEREEHFVYIDEADGIAIFASDDLRDASKIESAAVREAIERAAAKLATTEEYEAFIGSAWNVFEAACEALDMAILEADASEDLPERVLVDGKLIELKIGAVEVTDIASLPTVEEL